jgi:hypothetical protein
MLTVCVAVIGFFRGWYSFSKPRTNEEQGTVEIKLTVDKDKVKEDAEALQEKASEFTGENTKGAGQEQGLRS